MEKVSSNLVDLDKVAFANDDVHQMARLHLWRLRILTHSGFHFVLYRMVSVSFVSKNQTRSSYNYRDIGNR